MSRPVESNQQAVILVHGILMKSFMMRLLGHHCKKAGFNVYYYSYPSILGQSDANIAGLGNLIDQLQEKTIHLVGHSLGGLICLEASKQRVVDDKGRVVLLASPIRGSVVVRKLSDNLLLKNLLAKARELLVKGVSFVGLSRDIGMIAGTKAVGISRFLVTIERPCDGVVAVSETLHEACNDKLQLHVSHAGMLLSSQVGEQVIHFLKHGVFRR